MGYALSVVICTHNPRVEYLMRVLSALQSQSLARDTWELLVVDNASGNSVVERVDLSWHPHARIYTEPKIGKTHALLTGFRESVGELIVIVDDDNVLDASYLETAVSLGQRHPFLGLWGGTCLAEFEVAPPAALEKYLNRLAISTVKRPRWGNSYTDFDAIPPGAGMVLRREVALAYQSLVADSQTRHLLGPIGTLLTRSDDTDLAWAALDGGFGVGRFPDLILTHLIPRSRLDPEYILRLIEGDAASRVVLDRLHQKQTFEIQEPARFRQLWLRLRLSEFDYRAWVATRAGIRAGLRTLKQLGL